MEHQCASRMFSEGATEELCDPLAQLKREHGSLRAQMDKFAETVNAIISERGTQHWRLELVDLEIKVKEFMKELG